MPGLRGLSRFNDGEDTLKESRIKYSNNGRGIEMPSVPAILSFYQRFCKEYPVLGILLTFIICGIAFYIFIKSGLEAYRSGRYFMAIFDFILGIICILLIFWLYYG
jgi:hypothetical protein